jgi:hypothetical protein
MSVKSAFIRLGGLICLLALNVSFKAVPDKTAHREPQPKGACAASLTGAGEITIFFTGNQLGELKPCGCSGGQLGGLDRRYAILGTTPPENRLIFDTGSLALEPTEQNLIKFNVIVQALSHLGYEVINLTEQDILIARQAGLLEGMCQIFGCITACPVDDLDIPVKFTKQFSINGRKIDVTVGVVDTPQMHSNPENLFSRPPQTTVNILIVNRSGSGSLPPTELIQSCKGLVDCIIVPPQSDEPTLIGDSNDTPLVITQSRLGKYVGKIRVMLEGQSDSSDRSGRPQLSFCAVAVTGDLPQEQELVGLYTDYQRLVKDANLLEKYPRFVLPDNLEYVGSKSCKLCHDYEYHKWMTSPPVILPDLPPAKSRHSNAFATLVDVNSDYDPECVICHVVGMRYETGFVTSERTPQLKDVGCENCHGPGSEHVRSLGAVETAGPKSSCTDCHTPEQSVDYAANEKQYNEKVIHWRTPLSRTKVEENR